MTLTPEEMAQLVAEDDAYDARCARLEEAAERAFARVEADHAARYLADMNARFAAIEARYGPLDAPIGEGRA